LLTIQEDQIRHVFGAKGHAGDDEQVELCSNMQQAEPVLEGEAVSW